MDVLLSVLLTATSLHCWSTSLLTHGSINLINNVLWFYVPARPWLLMVLLSIVCMAAGAWVYFDIRETKGLGFEAIDAVYQGKLSNSRAIDEEELQVTR
jgi:hypothetical protein